MTDIFQGAEQLGEKALDAATPGIHIGSALGHVWRPELQGLEAIPNQWDKHFGSKAIANWQTDYPTRTSRGYAQAPGADLPSARGVAAPGAKPMTKEQKQQAAETAGGVVSNIINPVNWPIDPASALGIAGHAGEISQLAQFAGAPAVHAMMSGDVGALAWSAVTGALMGGGKLGEMGRFVEAALPGVSAMAKDGINFNTLARRIADNPYNKDLPEYLKNELDSANEELAQRAKATTKANMVLDPETREIAQKLTAAQKKLRSSFFKQVGVKDEAGFKNYLTMGGELSQRQVDFLKSHYKDFLFTDPLLYEDREAGQYMDPMSHLEDMKGQDPQSHTRGVQAIGAFHALKELADRGPFSHDNPAVAILRGAVGWNHSLDFFDQRFSEALKAVAPGMDGTKLARVIEEGGSASPDYEALSPTEKFTVDLYRLYAHMSNVYQRRAGIKVGTVGSYVPRIPHMLSTAKRGTGRAKSVLISDFSKSRQWRLSAVPKVTSVSPGELAPIKRQLGNLGSQLSDEDLAVVHQLVDKMGVEDGEHALYQLRQAGGVGAASKLIKEWAQNTQSQEHQLQFVQRFRTIGDLNAHLSERRKQFTEALMNAPTVAGKLAEQEIGVPLDLNDPEIKRIISEKDTSGAEALAAQYFAPVRDNLFDILGTNHFARQFKSAHASEVVKELEKTVVDLGGGRNGFAAVRSKGGRADEVHLNRGYRPVKDSPMKYAQHLFAPEVAGFIERGTRGADLGLVNWLGKLEQKTIGAIMYNPLFHSWNMFGRAGAFGLTHPAQLVHWIKNNRAMAEMDPVEQETAHQLQRVEAWAAGVVTPHQARTVASDMGSALSNSLGDDALHDLGISRVQDGARGMKKIPGMGKVMSAYEAPQRYMWNKIGDFGVMVYHIEKEAATRAGADEMSAMMWAARRANSWMGHVSELDHNQTLHSMARLVMFAPNYWRTFAELMLPVYMRSGIEWSPEMTGYVTRQQVATMLSMVAMQKATGNVANWITSGHWQNQNQNGKQDYIEISRPEIVNMLKAMGYPGADKIDSASGEDPATGGKLYLQNPLARQQYAAEQAAGLQSGFSDYKPEDAFHGSMKVAAARLSPLVDSLGALANIDVYNSLATGTIRNVNPDHDLPDGWNVAYAALGMTPLGLSTQSVAQEFKGANQPMQTQQGPFGTQVPKFVNDALGGARSLPMSIMSALTGVSAPYETAQKTRGTQVGDDTYRRLNAIDSQYQQQSTQLYQAALTGQMSPAQWEQQHSKIADEHRVQVEALIGNTPDYAQGTQGMVAQWEDLYAQATDPATQEVDPDQLAQLQAQFTSQHSQAEMDAMNAELNKAAQKDPMLKLYQQAQQGYKDWQQQYANQNGINVQKLRDESAAYGRLYGDPRSQRLYLHEHPELVRYRAAKLHQFSRSPQGRLYAAFFPNSTSSQYLLSSHLTPLAEAQQEAALIKQGAVAQ